MTAGACHSVVSTSGEAFLAGITMQSLTFVMMGAVLACSASAQFFQPFVPSAPGLGLGLQHLHPAVPQADHKRAYVHPAVQLNSEAESRLPSSLQNPFYKNPAIAAGLAKESWFTPGEEQVREREAEKIPRQKIYSILKNAGLARRRR